MTPRRDQEQTGLFHSFQADQAIREIDAIRAAAKAQRDAEIAARLGRLASGIGAAFAAIATAVVTWPERRRTYESLRALSDRDLADIGIARGDIARVFDPAFQMPKSAANTNQAAKPRVA